MLASLTDSVSGRPLYLRLADQLRADTAGKAYGARIESEAALTRRFGVSRFTVTRAVEILVDEGLLTRRQGLGTFVAAPRLKRMPNRLASFTEAMAAEGRVATHRLLAFGPTDAADPIALGAYPDGARLLRLDRLRFVDGAPTAIHRSVIDAAIAARVGLTEATAADPRFSLYRLFRKGGLVIDRGAEILRARRGTSAEARLLSLDGDRVVMNVRRETYAADGALLDVDEAVYDARRLTFQSVLRRSGEPAALSAA